MKIDKNLDSDEILFPEKVKQANENLKKHGLPKKSYEMKINEIKQHLIDNKYSDDEIAQFLEFSKPFHEFYSFMEQEHNLSYDEVEELSQNFSLVELPKHMNEIKGIEDVINISAKIMQDFASGYNYTKINEIGESMKYLLQLTLINQLTNK